MLQGAGGFEHRRSRAVLQLVAGAMTAGVAATLGEHVSLSIHIYHNTAPLALYA